MPDIEIIQISGREIIYIDYTGCKPVQMIAIFNQAKEIVLIKGDCLLLTNFERAYITPAFMSNAEKKCYP